MASTMLSSGPKLIEAADGVERVHRNGKRVFAQNYKESLVGSSSGACSRERRCHAWRSSTKNLAIYLSLKAITSRASADNLRPDGRRETSAPS